MNPSRYVTAFPEPFPELVTTLLSMDPPPRRRVINVRVSIDPKDPMWKRVAKDRARRKAAKQQKKRMRSH